jgi:peptidase M10/serralysin-like protein
VGNDVFDFNAVSDSTPAAWDTIVGFDKPGASTADRIDLSGMDANTQLAGNQAFKIGGTGLGTLKFTESGGDTVLLGNTDGDATIELRIVIDDDGTPATAYTSNDVIL